MNEYKEIDTVSAYVRKNTIAVNSSTAKHGANWDMETTKESSPVPYTMRPRQNSTVLQCSLCLSIGSIAYPFF